MHAAPGKQSPQLTSPPQLFVAMPQTRPVHAAGLLGVQPQTFAVPPPPQVSGALQVVGQTTFSPQLLLTVPHFPEHAVVLSATQPVGAVEPVGPVGVCVPVGAGAQFCMQLSMFPQPSLTMPQLTAWASHVVGVHRPARSTFFLSVAAGHAASRQQATNDNSFIGSSLV